MRKKITLILFFGLISCYGLYAQACGSPGNPNPNSPVFSFSANNVCAQQDVTMSIDSPEGGVIYTWDFGDNSLPVDSIPEGTSVVHAFSPNESGATYTVTAYAETASGCITSYSATITTLATPEIEADGVFSACLASNSTQTTFTTTIQITNHNGGSYDWDFGDGTSISTTDSEVTHTFVGYGTFDLVISQSNGTCTGSFTQTIRFLKRPTANMNIVGDADICEGDTLYVANNTASTNVDFYVLDWGDGQRDTLIGTDTLFHVYDFSDMDPCSFPQVGLEMDVELIAVNQCFEHSNGSPIFVSIPPQTQFSGPGTIICASDPVVDFSNLTCPDGGGGFDTNTYVWTFGDPTTGDQDTAFTADPTHSFSGPGTYTVTLTASSNCGSVTSTGEIIVYEDALADGDYTTNSPIVTANGDGCGPLEVSVLENSSGDSLSVEWAVSPAAGWAQTGGDSITPVYTFTDPGTYTLTLGANNLCGSSSWDTTVVILGQPTANLSPIPNGCDSYTYTPSASFTNGGGTISGYSWNFPGGSPSSSSSSNPSGIVYSSPGTYTVTVDVTTECGTASDTQTFTIYASPTGVDAGPDLTVCSSASSFLMTDGSPSGGTWSGTGVLNPFTGMFDPGTAGIGSHTVTYTYTENGCSSSDTRIITVVGPPSVDGGPSVSVCEDVSAFNLTGASPSGGTWSGTGITDSANGTFDPSISGPGAIAVSYTYTDPVSGCEASDLKLIFVYALPTVSVGVPQTYCVTPVDINLPTATPSGGTWTGPGVVDGSAGTFNSVAAGGVGSYTLTYSYTDGNGCTNSADLDVTVTTIITPDAGPDETMCADDPILTLTGFTPAGGTWSGTGITNSSGIFDPSVSGTGTHVLTYTYGTGTCEQSDTKEIYVAPVPTVVAGSDEEYCVDVSAFTLSGFSPSGGTWTGLGITNAAGTFDPSVSGSGSFTLTYTFVNAQGCDQSDTKVVTINPLPSLTMPSPLSICNSANDYTITGFSPTGGSWSGTGITDGANAVFNPFAAGGVGTYTVTYTYTDGNGCSNSATLAIEVVPPEVPDAGPSETACIDDGAFSLSGFSPAGGTWTGDGITNTSGIFDPSVAGTGTHILTYTYGTGTCERTDTKEIYVSPLPTVSAGPDIEICEDENSFTLTGMSPSGGTWTGSGITDPSGEFDPSGLGDGVYTLTYTYTNIYGCVNADTRSVLINALPNISMPADLTLCETNMDVTITGYTPTGGTWSGTGITDGLNGVFNPVAAGGIGTYTLTYSYTDVFGCTNTANYGIEVIAATVPDAGPDGGFCIDDSPQNLTGFSPSGGTFTGSGITDAINGTFDPVNAGIGTHTITYTIGSGTCERSDTRVIAVGAIPTVEAGIDLTACSADPAFTLTGNAPSGGIWSGTGVSSGQFDPTAVGVGTYTITYSYTDPVTGCQNFDTRSIEVLEAPTVYAGPDISYCNIPADITLTGYSPTGGIWSGPGLVDAVAGIFNTVSAGGVGTYALIYTYTSNNNCQNSDTLEIEVTPLETVDAGPDVDLCINDGLQTLNGTPVGGTWSGTGIIDPTNGIFDPGTAGQGLHILTYTYGSGTCQVADVTRYLVGTPPTVITGDDLSVCIDEASFALTGFSPQGGSWAGSGITNVAGVFDPATAGLGAHVLTYTYTNPSTGCYNSSNQIVTVTPIPVVEAGDTLNLCVTSTDVTLTGMSPAGGTWTGPGIVDGSAGVFNALIAGGEGTYNLTYTYTDANGCSNTDFRAIVVVPGPPIDAGADESVCLSNGPFSLTGFTPAGGTWTGTGIVNASGIFDPAIAGPGTHVLTYTYGAGTCITIDSKTIFVGEPTPLVTGDDLLVCEGAAAFTLTGFSPQGGSWSGTGITDPVGIFDPAIGIGTYTLTYTYSNPVTGCVSTGTRSVQVSPLPTVNAGPDEEICDNLANYLLTGFAPSGGTWSGTGIVDAANGLFNTVAAGGTGVYTITYTYVDANGCSNSDTKEVTVVDPDPIEAGPDDVLCIGDGLLQLAGFSPAGGTWSGTGVVNPTLGIFDPSVAGTGTHILTYSIGVGTCLSTDTKIVTVGSPAAIIAGPDQSVCEDQLPFSFTGFSPSGGFWTGTGVIDSSGVFDPSVAGIGIHTVTYTYFNSVTGCFNINSKTVTVNGLPIVDAGPDVEICNSTDNYTLASGSPIGGVWSGPGLVNANNGIFNSVLAGGVGTYTLVYTYVDGNGCEASDQLEVDVIAPPTVIAGPDINVCIDEGIITLSGNSPTGGTWVGTGIINGLLGTFDTQTAGAGTHIITYTYGTGTCEVSDTRIVFVGEPTPIVTGADNVVCSDDVAFSLSGFSPTGGYWTGTGITDSLGIFDPQVSGVGTFAITYTFLNPVTGCENAATKEVTVQPLPVVDAGPNVTVCNTVNNVTLTGYSPTGGAFSGPGIVDAANGIFNTISAGGLGTYDVFYTYTDGFGCTNIDSMEIEVIFGDTVVAGPDISICITDGNQTLTGQSPIGGTFSGPGIVDASAGVFDPQAAGPGEHFITYTFGSGTCEKTDIRRIFVGEPADITPGPDMTVCSDELSFNLTGFSPVGGFWTGVGITDSTGFFDPQVSGLGLFTLTYTFLNPATGCVATGERDINVVAPPSVYAGGDVTYCNTLEDITLSGYLPTGGFWSGPGIVNSTVGVFNSVLAGGTGDYELVYSYTDGNGCSSTDTLQVEVIEPDPVEAGPNMAVCIDDNAFSLFDFSPAGGTWTGPGIIDPVNGVFDPALAGPGTHAITYTIGTGTCEVTDLRLIVVGTIPPVEAGGDVTVCEDEMAFTLTGFSPPGGFWLGNGIVDSTSTFDPQIAGPGAHILTYTYVHPVTGCVNFDNRNVIVRNLPTVDAGGPTTFCDNGEDTFLSGYSPTGGFWSGPGIVDANFGVFNTTVAGGIGVYDLVYTYTDNFGCTNTDTLELTVIPSPPIDAGPDLAVCVDDGQFLLSGTPAGGTFAGPGIINPVGTFDPQLAGPGTYMITYTQGTGTCEQQDILFITVGLPEIVEAGAPESLCIDHGIYQLPAAIPLGGTWVGAGIVDPVNGMFNPAVAGEGTHSLVYTYVDPVTGCVSNDSKPMTVTPLPIVFAGPDETHCDNPNPIVLSNFSPAGGTWSGFGIVDEAGIFSTQAAGGIGLYPLVYSFTDQNGCTNTDTMVIEVIIGDLVDAGPDLNLCIDDPVQSLLGQSPLGGTFSGQGIVSPSGLFDPAMAGPGTHTVTYTYGTGSCEKEDQRSIFVGLPADVDAGLDQGVCIGSPEVQLTGSPTGGYWIGLGVDSTGLFDPALTGVGSFELTYTFVDALTGCVASDTMQMSVNDLPVVTAGGLAVFCDNPNEIPLANYSPEGGLWQGPGIIDPSLGIFSTSLAGGVGNYDLVYTFTDPNGCSNSDTLEVQVIFGNIVDAGPDEMICIDQGEVTLNQYAPSGGFWSGPGIIDPNAGIFDPAQAGPGIHVLTYTEGSGSCEKMDTREIEVIDLSFVEAGPDQSVCLQDMNMTLSGQNPLGGTWVGAGITDPVNGIFNPLAAGVGTHTLVYTFTDTISGCSYPATKQIVVNPLPIANFAAPVEGCVGDEIPFTNSSIDAINYQWFFGDNGSSVFVDPIYIYDEPGIYDVTMVATTAFGCTDTVTYSIDIAEPPVAFFEVDQNDGCGPLPVNVNNLSEGTGVDFSWDFGNGFISSDSLPETVFFQPALNDTTYFITLEVTNRCGSDSYTLPIEVDPSPSVVFGTDVVSGCTPLAVNFTNITQGFADDFFWDFGNGQTSTDSIPGTVFFTTDSLIQDYTITLIATNECGADTSTQTVTVTPGGVTSFFNVDTDFGCAPLAVQFTNFSTPGSNVSWDFGDGNVSIEPSPQHVYDSVGTFTVVQYIDNECGVDSSSTTIVVAPPSFVGFDHHPFVCLGQSIQFTNNSEPASGFLWDFGDGTVSSLTNPQHTYLIPGDFTVTLVGYSAETGCPSTTTSTITVLPNPVSSFQPNVTNGCAPLTIDFANNSDFNNFSSWDFGDGNMSVANSPSHTYETPGTYQVTLVTTDLNGCYQDTSIANIVVFSTPTADFETAYDQLCDLSAEVRFQNTSTSGDAYFWDFGNGQTSILTNPTVGFDGPGDYEITLIASNSFGCADTLVRTFTVFDGPIADLSMDVQSGCAPLRVNFEQESFGATSFFWDFGDGITSTEAFPVHVYEEPGQYDVSLVASVNGFCADTIEITTAIWVLERPQAEFESQEFEAEVTSGTINFTNYSTGAIEYAWDFGDGSPVSNEVNPSHRYEGNGTRQVMLIATNEYSCSDTTIQAVLPEFFGSMFVPNALSPEAGVGETRIWRPSAVGLIEYRAQIFSPWGELLWESTILDQNGTPMEGWDGRYKNELVPQGAYVWKVWGIYENGAPWPGVKIDGVYRKIGSVTVLR